MRVLVTGGAGYIGSHALSMLLDAGHEAWAYDNLSRGHRASVPPERLILGDVLDGPCLERALVELRIDAVMNFAAVIQIGESVTDPGFYYRTNVGGALSLLEAMRRAGVERLVHSSTTAVVGVPERVPIVESAPRAAINPYGRSKAMIEEILEDYAGAYGWRIAALRYFNAAGACPSGERGEDHDPESHLIPITLSVALGQRSHLTILGDDYPTRDGTCIRDYVHVVDLAAAHLGALERLNPGKLGIYNLGTGRGVSVREVVEACRRATGHPIPVQVAPRRPGDAPELVADPSRAREQLGWVPQFQDIDSIVSTAWNWHRRHPRGYGDRGN